MIPEIDIRKNRIPDHVRKIHMIAACGTGMGALACMLQEMGFDVTGSDQNVYPPMSDFLRDKGIRLFKGFNTSNLDYKPDVVIIGNVISRGNVEAERVIERGLPYCSMPQALNHFAACCKKRIVVTGTHGKTTTSSLIAHILHHAGLDPSFMIGGILKGFGSNYRIGTGDYIVLEGDEYDTAFFDKGPKFMHYPPDIAVITGVEFDHADIFRDLEHIKEIFSQFVKKIPSSSLVMAFGEDKNLPDILPAAKCEIQYYGNASDDRPCGNYISDDRPCGNYISDDRPCSNYMSDDGSCGNYASDEGTWSCSHLKTEGINTLFTLKTPEGEHLSISTPMMGRHNAMNIMAAFGTARRAGVSDDVIVDALKVFKGIRRRQDIRGVKNGITVMDDFAHHPSEVKETIRAVKPFFQNGRLIAVFEPRTNSSMRDIFQNDYPSSFDHADMVCIRKPSMLVKIIEDQRLSTEKLIADIAGRGVEAYYFENTETIIDFLGKSAHPGDILLIMSNGGFDNIHQKLLESL